MACPSDIFRACAVFDGKISGCSHLSRIRADEMNTEFSISFFLRKECAFPLDVVVRLRATMAMKGNFDFALDTDG